MKLWNKLEHINCQNLYRISLTWTTSRVNTTFIQFYISTDTDENPLAEGRRTNKWNRLTRYRKKHMEYSYKKWTLEWYSARTNKLQASEPAHINWTSSDRCDLFLGQQLGPSHHSPPDRACSNKLPSTVTFPVRMQMHQELEVSCRVQGAGCRATYWKTKSGIVSCSRGTYLNSCTSLSTYTTFFQT